MIIQKEREMESRMAKRAASISFVGLLLLAACSQPLSTREKGAVGGGLLGAATGAIIGAATGSPAKGAAIGAGLGALGGGLAGHQLQKQEAATAEQQKVVEQQQQEIARNRQLLEELKKRDLEVRETERGVVVNLPSILFEFGKADLTSDARVKVRNVADVLSQQARGRRVAVEGHTDSIGGEEYNQRLSEQRAQSVASVLETEGVSDRHLTVKGYGKRYPIAPNTSSDGSDNPAGRAKNRRVEVVIEN
jgi:outer membrane protein OmpA-like peptidoglycan-associated protein